MKEIYSQELLIKTLHSKQEMVALWGAYQFLVLYPDQFSEVAEHFFNSEYTEIQEAGIAKINAEEARKYSAELAHFFRSGNSLLKGAAAICMAKFPNDISTTMLHKWFEDLKENRSYTHSDFEAASYALLLENPERNLPYLLSYLNTTQEDLIKSSILFKLLLQFCDSEVFITELVDQYFILRELYSDADLTYHMLFTLDQMESVEWLNQQLSLGFKVSSIYEESLALLEIQITQREKDILEELESSFPYDLDVSKAGQPSEFITQIQELTESVFFTPRKGMLGEKLLGYLTGFYKNQTYFNKTIPKIFDLEKSFILSIPLLIAIENQLENWLDAPEKYTHQLAQYYHSYLLRNQYREKILKLFFPAPIVWPKEKTLIHSKSVPVKESTSIHEILWLLYRGELLGVDLNWPSLFPNPDISIHLTECLIQIYRNNFAYFVKKNDKIAVDYALQLFQLMPGEQNIQLIVEHFESLYQYHTAILYQTIEYQPHPDFLPLLTRHYHKEEYETAELILFISEIFQQDLPAEIQADMAKYRDLDHTGKGFKNRIRLQCESCQSVWQYPVNVIYVDEEVLNQSNKLKPDSIWVEETFNCRRCKAPLSPVLDEKQLDEIAKQSRMNLLLKLAPEPSKKRLGQGIIIFPFPQYRGKTYNPHNFIKLISELEKTGDTTKQELEEALFKLASLYEVFEAWSDVKSTLLKIDPEEQNMAGLKSRLGVAEYKLSNLPEARTHFSKLVTMEEQGQLQNHDKLYLDLANFYLGIINSKDTLRSQLKVIKGKR